MARRQAYDYVAALNTVRRRARSLSPGRVDKLSARYVAAVDAPIGGFLLRWAERRAWGIAHGLKRANAARSKLCDLAEISNAARNAGLAVLVRDHISKRLFRRLTRVWRRTRLPLPPAPKTNRA